MLPVKGPNNAQLISERFSTLADQYNDARPVPPGVLIKVIRRLTEKHKLQLVVDLGCGTGLSTRPWSEHSERVIGLDNSQSMIEYAVRITRNSNVSFRKADAQDTGLEDECADIVTCSSSIHWMNPDPSFEEIVRILKPGGIFAAYGPQVPYLPLCSWKAGVEFNKLISLAKRVELKRYGDAKPKAYKWAEVLDHLRHHTGFRYADELCFHSEIEWTAKQFCNWAGTISYVHDLLHHNDDQIVSAYRQFENHVTELLGKEPCTFLQCYRLLLGIK